jgi:hypothetical protein
MASYNSMSFSSKILETLKNLSLLQNNNRAKKNSENFNYDINKFTTHV